MTKGVTVRVPDSDIHSRRWLPMTIVVQCRRCPRPILWTCRVMRIWDRKARILWFWGPDQTKSR